MWIDAKFDAALCFRGHRARTIDAGDSLWLGISGTNSAHRELTSEQKHPDANWKGEEGEQRQSMRRAGVSATWRVGRCAGTESVDIKGLKVKQ